MDIFRIESQVLYSVKYENELYDEYNRLFEDNTDLEKVIDFFETHKWHIDNYYIKELGISPIETEAYANLVINEAMELEEYFEQLIDNSVNHERPDLFAHFKNLEGFENSEYPAMKSYGLSHPSLLRVYAIEVDASCYIIFYSGIKIAHKLKDSPGLKDNVIKKAREVIAYLKEQGVTDVGDVDKLAQ